jgi:hypothetical protein
VDSKVDNDMASQVARRVHYMLVAVEMQRHDRVSKGRRGAAGVQVA